MLHFSSSPEINGFSALASFFFIGVWVQNLAVERKEK